MKKLKIVLLILISAIIVAGLILLFILEKSKPVYEGVLQLNSPQNNVDVKFDDYGIPHIKAENNYDAFYALGYLHAQERLFQMDLLRRVGSGRLSEIFGKELTRIDVFFRTLGIAEHAAESEKKFLQHAVESLKRETFAYLDGVNEFVKHGKTPPEYLLPGINKEPFTLQDVFCITGYMAFSFAEAIRTDPVLNNILYNLGPEYFKVISETQLDSTAVNVTAPLLSVLNQLPVPPFIGSNAWAVSSSKSVSGKPLFANDTHIGYAQPCVWYEAHLEYPGMSVYGNFLAGFPFPLIGHTRHHAWGMTMLENDDMDFYSEKLNSDSTKYLAGEEWLPLQLRKEIIKRKDAADTSMIIRSTRNGPLMNDAMDNLSPENSAAVSLWWLFTRFENVALQASRQMMNASSIEEMRLACKTMVSPGLNIVYADTTGNIAFWAAGKMLKRPAHVNSKVFIDGTKNENTQIEYYSFEENPQEENPERGFVFSANRLPDSLLHIHSGYYAPPDRSLRIEKLLSGKAKLDMADMKRIQTDNFNDVYASMANRLAGELKVMNASVSKNGNSFLEMLQQWKGEHELNSTGPVLFYKLISELLDRTMADELDSVSYLTIKTSHHIKSVYQKFLFTENSPWWDDKRTTDKIETRNEILADAFTASVSALENQLGPNPANWIWNRVHTLTHVHALGRQPPMDYFFNVGPFAAPGGNETINCSGFPVASNGNYKVMYGPAMRIVIDLSDINAGESILPTGQSGHFMSRHYDDQAKLYLNGDYRNMIFELSNESLRRKLLLKPFSKK